VVGIHNVVAELELDVVGPHRNLDIGIVEIGVRVAIVGLGLGVDIVGVDIDVDLEF
jgi:hypothetical protein